MISGHTKQNRRKQIRELDARIGARMRQLRIAHGRTQEEVAEALGVSFQQVQKYENGRTRLSAATLTVWLDSMDLDLMLFFSELARSRKPARR